MTRAELLKKLREAEKRVARWPRWKKIVFERSWQAEEWFEQQGRK